MMENKRIGKYWKMIPALPSVTRWYSLDARAHRRGLEPELHWVDEKSTEAIRHWGGGQELLNAVHSRALFLR